MRAPTKRERGMRMPYLHPDPVNIEIHACMDDEGDMDMDTDRYWHERYYLENCPKWLQECHRLEDLGFRFKGVRDDEWPDLPARVP